MSELPRYGEEVNVAIARQLRRLRPASILDIGCGAGQNTAFARSEWGAYVGGVDNFRVATAVASTRLDEVLLADIEKGWGINGLEAKRFWCLVFGDVLEHVSNPLDVLKRYLKLLHYDGTVIVSLPNVANWAMRLHLLAGRFQYEPKGIRDASHLRFFTRESAVDLCLAAGLVVETVDQTPGVCRDALDWCRRELPADVDARVYAFYKRRLRALEERVVAFWPEALAFQHVIVARKR